MDGNGKMDTDAFSVMLGRISLLSFIAANAYFPAKLITNRFIPGSKQARGFLKKYLDLHKVLNLAAFLIVAFHGYFSDERNALLQWTMLVTLWLTIIGALMHYGFPPGMNRQYRLVHSQQAMFVIWVALIIAGHAAL